MATATLSSSHQRNWRLLGSMLAAFAAGAAALSIASESRWDMYYAVFTVEYLAAVIVFPPAGRKARRALRGLAVLLAPGFAAAFAIRVLEIVR